jgi:hypothetical protein
VPVVEGAGARGGMLLDTRPTVLVATRDAARGAAAAAVSARFHAGLASATARACAGAGGRRPVAAGRLPRRRGTRGRLRGQRARRRDRAVIGAGLNPVVSARSSLASVGGTWYQLPRSKRSRTTP